LFEMLVGRCPFEGDAVAVLRQHVLGAPVTLPPGAPGSDDPAMAALLRRLVASAPENRFATADEVREAIDAMAPPVAGPVSAPARTPSIVRPEPRRLGELATPRRVAIGAGVVGIGIVALLVVALATRSSSGTPAAGAGGPAPAPGQGADADAAPAASASAEGAGSVVVLPPPPTPSSGSGAAPAAKRGRRTGPGGIYVPPPSTWFK
jgi:hypothetical protein